MPGCVEQSASFTPFIGRNLARLVLWSAAGVTGAA